MPGFESKRFVNISEAQKEDLMCGICLAIVNNPLTAKCCKQLYCYDCIKEWLSCSTTCPYDRNLMNMSDLQTSDKVSHLMKDLEIHCEYEGNGCDQTVRLSGLSEHSDGCLYNPFRKCITCGLIMGDIHTHNCIERLIEEKEKLLKETIELKSQLNSYKETHFEDEKQCWDNPICCM